MVLATACLSLIMSNSFTLNFTIIYMSRNNACPDQTVLDNINGSSGVVCEGQDYSTLDRSLFFSAIAVGSLIGIPPMAYVVTHYGVR